MSDTWPTRLIDRDGDEWTWDPNDEMYCSGGLSPRSRRQLESDYGPLKAPDHLDVRLLLAEALEDVARKLRESA
ncbi:hypothetical protein ACFWFX_27105 [Streptomyces roseolus]|uniref:hypothetical protein n=1 Tax=Streptomyces roseolus TaxID=67358 RepID=UPI0036661E95